MELNWIEQIYNWTELINKNNNTQNNKRIQNEIIYKAKNQISPFRKHMKKLLRKERWILAIELKHLVKVKPKQAT